MGGGCTMRRHNSISNCLQAISLPVPFLLAVEARLLLHVHHFLLIPSLTLKNLSLRSNLWLLVLLSLTLRAMALGISLSRRANKQNRLLLRLSLFIGLKHIVEFRQRGILGIHIVVHDEGRI